MPSPTRSRLGSRLRRLRNWWRIRRSGLRNSTRFSGPLYLAANPDVAAAGLDPLLHYLLDGWAQGRPLRRGPHTPLRLPPSAVLTLSERIAAALRPVWPRCRVLRAEPGPDPALTIAVRPARGAMPTGWCLISARGGPATLLVRSGNGTQSVEAPGEPVLVRLPAGPARLALQRHDRPGPLAAPRPEVTVCEIGALLRLRARRRGTQTRDLLDASSYPAWVARFDTPDGVQTEALAKRAARLYPAPTFSLVPTGPHAATPSSEMQAHLAAQLYPHWTLCSKASEATGDFVALLDAETMLAPWALLLVAEAIAADPAAEVIYGDEDQWDAGERHSPWFKPDFSPELASGIDLLGAFAVVRSDAAVLDRPESAGRRVVHIPHVLAHTMRPPASGRAIVRFAGDDLPTVTAIVPTRDQAAVLRACLDGLLDATDYPNLDIIVADNGSVEPETASLLDQAARRGVTVLPCPGPFNYSAINNRAAATARGEWLLFLNNDISILEPNWLREMVRLATPDVGAVGAKLLYPDGTLQHGGVVLGMGGVAGHIHQGAAGDDPGYFGRLGLVQEVAAVTAACMIVPARHFAAIGGFDAAELAVAFNDIDLCLRLRRAGLRVLWTPHAVLRHWESKSRGSDLSLERRARFTAEIATMQTRWSEQLAADPFYSPNLSLESGEPTLAFPPRVARPWM